jgi:AraC family transcriptional regulator
MAQTLSIFQEALRQNVMPDELELLHQQDKHIPNSVQYSIRRYRKQDGWQAEDTGMLVYNFVKKNSDENALELKFCVSGNAYCHHADCNGGSCKKADPACNDKNETLDVFAFRFTPSYLGQFLHSQSEGTRAERILSFQHKQAVAHIVPLCAKNRVVLDSLLSHRYTDSLGNIFLNAQIQSLLLYSLECLFGGEKEEVFTCKFLANEDDRSKIARAREILLQHIGEPITIKELARKVATNECYLKKGFKEMFGTTVFDFYQGQRMEHAKYLLYEKSLSVTDVSALLGYSSISHFSTAFKKHTGLKPCELLIR